MADNTQGSPPPTAPTDASDTGADPYKDHATIKALVDRKRADWAKGRENVVRASWRNLLFLRGQQWIRWDRGISRWRPARLPKNTPVPVTNVYAAAMDAVIAVFARVEPSLNFRPGNPDEPEDRATADVAARAIQVIEDETKVRFNRQILAGWVGHTGGAWLESGYDPDPIHGMRTLEVDKCQSCGAMQAPSAPPTEPMMDMPAASPCEACGGPTAPASEQVPIGKQYVDVVSIFEMYFDPSVADWTKQRAYLREKSVSLDEAKGRWPALADSLSPNVMSGNDEWYTDALATLGPAVDENGGPRIGTGGGRMVNTRVTEQWYWQMPDATYPEGLLAIIVGKSQVGFAGPLPYGAKTADGGRQPFLPFVFFPQKLVPGSMFTKTVADDVAAKQIQRNQWESIVQACGMRMGSPVWLKPAGSNVRNLTGDPGSIVEYNSLGPGSAKPERVPGQGIPMSFIQMIERCDKDIENLAACLTGDQEIPCLDGQTRTMAQLAAEFPEGGTWVYGFDLATMRIVPSRVESAFRTGRKRCIRVSFHEGTHVDCSHDHPWLTWDRGYVNAEDLRPNDSIVPLIFGESEGYAQVLQPTVGRGRMERVHRMVAHAKWGVPVHGDRRHVHHKDENKTNNLPDNLALLGGGEHTSLWWQEKDEEARQRRLDPMLFALRQYWASLSLRERSERNKAAWATVDAETRREHVRPAVEARGEEWSAKKSAERRAWWANRSQEERDAHGAKMRAARANHSVLSVEEIGEHDVYDLQTTTGNFGTAAGVIGRNTYDVIKGARPEGVSAGIALQILQERGMSRYGPLFILWEFAWSEWARQALEIFREFATEERLLRIKGRDGQWQVQKFIGADLQGRVDVVPEAGSSMPRSSLVDRAELEQLVAIGVLPPPRTDPELQQKFLEIYGRTNLTPGMAADTKNAVMENEAFEKLADDPTLAQATPDDVSAAQEMDYPSLLAVLEQKFRVKIPRVRAAIDDHGVHSREHGICAKGESFQQLPMIVQVIAESHKRYHDILRIEQMQAVQAAQQPGNAQAGFMAPAPARTQVLNTSSSPGRMEGDYSELERDASATTP